MSHEKNRLRICLMCKKSPKKKYFKTTGIVGDYLKILYPDFNINDLRLPAVVCDVCRLKLTRSAVNPSSNNLQMPDYKKYRFSSIKTRASTSEYDCECTLCNEVRAKYRNLDAARDKKNKNTAVVCEKRCFKCFNVVGRGKRHQCNSVSLLKNIEANVVTKKSAEHLVSSLLKNKIIDNQEKHPGSHTAVSLSQYHGKPMSIIVYPKKQRDVRKINSQDVVELQNHLNLSDRKVLEVSKFIRSKTNQRFIIEPNAYQKMIANSHNLEKYFNLHNFDFEIKKQNNVTAHPSYAVVCTDLSRFISHVINKRDVYDFHLNFGIDGGGKSLKFTLAVQSKNEQAEKKTKFKDTGVKKIFLIALAQHTQENDHNVSSIWSQLKINDCLDEYPATITTDLKLSSIISGLSANSSFYPCIWCDISKDDLNCCGILRTTQGCAQNYRNWCKDGSVKKKMKYFKSCINLPMFYSENDQLILDVMPPPELHLLLGCVNKLYEHLEKCNPNIAKKWARQCHVEKKFTNGGNYSFEGNSCKLLLKNVDKLQQICEAENDIMCMGYVDALRKFGVVVGDCFSVDLKKDYQRHIEDFQKSYESLQISVTPKIHAIFHHV